MASVDLINSIDDLLPQTQCEDCGYKGCRPYAEAMANGEAINRCPPGGDDTVAALSNLLARPIIPLAENPKPLRIAFIREDECIGCTKCIQACPVDAIVGAAKLMHTVIADECTGCDLCVEPCPVDCIDMIATQHEPNPAHYRTRFLARNARLQHDHAEREKLRAERTKKIAQKNAVAPTKSKQQEIIEAIARAKAKRADIH